MAEQRQKETLCSDNCCYYPEVRSLNLTRSRCVIRQMVQIWLTSRGFVYGRFATLGRKHRDWHDGPVLAGCRSVCWGLCVSFDQMPMGCWTCVGGGGCWGGLHIGGRHGWWWMFGILDGWACVASLSCEGLKYYNPSPAQCMMYWQSYGRPLGSRLQHRWRQQSTAGTVDRTTETPTKGQSRSVSAVACT